MAASTTDAAQTSPRHSFPFLTINRRNNFLDSRGSKKRKTDRKKKPTDASRKAEREAALRSLSADGSCHGLSALPISASSSSADALGTTFGHPYGVLPHGNVYLSPFEPPDKVRRNGLGTMNVLNDSQIQTVLSYCDGASLGRVVECSGAFYVAGHMEDLWRDLVLRDCDGKNKGFDYCVCWRDTYARSRCKKSNDFRPHIPFGVAGIYSDLYHRPHLCRSFAFRPEWTAIESVPRESLKTLTLQRFLSEYEEPNRPVIITDATASWPALKKWNCDYLKEATNGVKFRATSGAAPLPVNLSMEQYFSYAKQCKEEAPLYLFDRTFAETTPILDKDYIPALRSSLPMFDTSSSHGHDLFSLLGSAKRPDYRWLIIGPPRSGSAFHIDPNCTHAWNAPIRGSKRWIFYPPGVNPPGVHPSPDGDDVAMPISIGEWFLSYWNEHCERRCRGPKEERPSECTVNPGEILFVPHGWWHTVLNLEDADNEISVAITQNYVSASNLPDVLKFLKTRTRQISGCRDRVDAIQPEQLYEELKKSLEKERPELLELAEKRAEQGWGCKAWLDNVEQNGGSCEDCRNREVDGSDAEAKTNANADLPTATRTTALERTSVLERAKLPRVEAPLAILPLGDNGNKNVKDGTNSDSGFSFSFL